MNTWSKTFTFPKIAFYGKRKINQPEIEMELRLEDDGSYGLSISGGIWNGGHSDYVICGQCLDEMKPFMINDSLFRKLHHLWKLWHLNDMHPGSKSQEEALMAEFNCIPNYESACDYLKKINLYEDENGYIYGSGWQYWPIQESDLNEIKALLDLK